MVAYVAIVYGSVPIKSCLNVDLGGSSGEEFLNRFEADVLRTRSRFDIMERPSGRRVVNPLHPVNSKRRVDRAGDVFHID